LITEPKPFILTQTSGIRELSNILTKHEPDFQTGLTRDLAGPRQQTTFLYSNENSNMSGSTLQHSSVSLLPDFHLQFCLLLQVLMYYNVAIEDWAQGVFGRWFGTTSPDSAGLTLVSFKPTPDKRSDLVTMS